MIIIICFIVLISAGAFAQVATNSDIPEEVSDYIKSFVDNGGIKQDQINNVTQINQSSLPDEVEIKEIDENNIGIYQVDYSQNNQSKKVFVVTYSTNEFKKKETQIKNIKYLNFGYSGNSSDSGYLDTSTGVSSGNSNGYVMMHAGSIIGISTSIKSLKGVGEVYIKVYKNGQDTKFSNMISATDKKKIDYDLQSEGIVSYEPGDIISLYLEINGDVNWNGVTILLEITE